MKKMKIIIKLWFALTIALVSGCVEEFDADVDTIPAEGLVVEGNIISDSTVVFRLSKTLPLHITPDDFEFESYLEVDAEVIVKGNDGTFWLGNKCGRGQYQVAIGTLNPNVEYQLEILYNDDVYHSKPQKPLPVTDIERLAFKQDNNNGLVNIYLDTQKSENTQYFLWYFEENWEVHAVYVTTTLYDFEQDRIISYDYPPVAQGWCYSQTDQILLGTSEANVENRIVGKNIQTIENFNSRLSVLYNIRVQQRNLTPEEYEYYQERDKLNNEMGGLFTPQPTELPTNITCSNLSRKVVGYVGCNMGVAQRHLYISEREVDYVDHNLCDIGKDLPGSNKDKYLAGYQVAIHTPLGMEWARIECVDVTARKANPRGRPSWWPNPYLYDEEDSDDKSGLD